MPPSITAEQVKKLIARGAYGLSVSPPLTEREIHQAERGKQKKQVTKPPQERTNPQ